MLRIIHLSDFHYSRTNHRDFELYCLKPLINDLQKYKEKKSIDLIIFSGDMIDKGGASFDASIETGFLEFKKNVIEPLLENLELSKDKFIFVPGNHDIEQNADNKILETGVLSTLVSTQAVNEFIDENIDQEEVYGARRITAFKKFEKDFFKHTDHQISNFSSTYKFEFDGLKLGISCLNSAWRCKDSELDKGRILIGERQIVNAREQIEDCDLKIAVVHHPLDWLTSFEQKSIDQMIRKTYQIMLCGHVHEGESSYSTSLLGSLLVLVAPSNWTVNVRSNDRNFANGYSLIDIDGTDVIIKYRRYNHSKEAFVPDTDQGDEKGEMPYKLLSNEALTILKKKMKFVKSLEQIKQHKSMNIF